MFLATAMLAVSITASPDRVLEAIAQVESRGDPTAIGDGGRAVGAYQMHPAAWLDANAYRVAQGLPAYPRSRWREPNVQDGVAKAFLAVLEARLGRDGYQHPTPGLLALCWHRGYAGAKARGFRLDGYARRVETLTRK